MKWIITAGLILVFSFPVFAGNTSLKDENGAVITDQYFAGNYKSKLMTPYRTFNFTQPLPGKMKNSQFYIGTKKTKEPCRKNDKGETSMPWVFLKIRTGG